MLTLAVCVIAFIVVTRSIPAFLRWNERRKLRSIIKGITPDAGKQRALERLAGVDR